MYIFCDVMIILDQPVMAVRSNGARVSGRGGTSEAAGNSRCSEASAQRAVKASAHALE